MSPGPAVMPTHYAQRKSFLSRLVELLSEAMMFHGQAHPFQRFQLVERFFNKIKQCRRVATRYDKLAATYLAFIQLASIRLWLRVL